MGWERVGDWERDLERDRIYAKKRDGRKMTEVGRGRQTDSHSVRASQEPPEQ